MLVSSAVVRSVEIVSMSDLAGALTEGATFVVDVPLVERFAAVPTIQFATGCAPEPHMIVALRLDWSPEAWNANGCESDAVLIFAKTTDLKLFAVC